MLGLGAPGRMGNVGIKGSAVFGANMEGTRRRKEQRSG